MVDISDKKIVSLGGGTGLSAMLRGMKRYTENITAIVTVADDGGGSGMIREDFHLLPPGDIRNCILALADTEPLMEKLLRYRFTDGSLRGQSFGNLFLVAMYGISGSFRESIKRVSEVLAVTGRVFPVTEQDVNLCARFKDGTIVKGESIIPKRALELNTKIEEVYLCPSTVQAIPECIDAIIDADIVTLGPGSVYTSIIPNLLVDGISDAIKETKAKTVYICNVMTQTGETDGMSAFDHAKAIIDHSYDGIIDYCIVNTQSVQKDYIEKYKSENASPVYIDEDKFVKENIKLIKSELLDYSKGVLRHDNAKLASLIADIIKGE